MTTTAVTVNGELYTLRELRQSALEIVQFGGAGVREKFLARAVLVLLDTVAENNTERAADSPLVALLKAWPEAARITLGNRLLHYRQGAFIVFEQKRGLERIIATSDEAEAANALAGE